MHYANDADFLHHLLTKQQCVVLQAESSDHSLDSDMVLWILNPSICEQYKELLGALRSFD